MEGTSAPRPPAERYELIDALRGFALVGVCLVNLSSLSLYEFLDSRHQAALLNSRFDAITQVVVEWLVNIKFITIFSLLFGLGFALQLEGAQARGYNAVPHYVRRLLILLGIGAIHAWFVWWGDILFTYAVVGLLMVPFRHASNHVLLVSGLLVAVLPPLIAPAVRPLLPELAPQAQMYSRALKAFSDESWMQALLFNMQMSKWTRLSNWALVCFVLGRFLLGYWAGRTGLLQAPERHLPLLRRILFGALLAWLAATVLGGVQEPMRNAWPPIDIEPVKVAIRMLLRIGPLALGIAYAAGFALLYCRPGWGKRVVWLVPMGRMALTNYLTQSLIGIALFYGIGLGIGPRHGAISILTTCALVLALQARWSRWWLNRFQYGPAEWLWRWATYGERPRWRRQGRRE
ncbi:DUF418 domain-containing protein [Xanthomonas phaseoli]|uniref:DUF418 domain-containing protein n=1 Tax=Xanthomonas phaseoli TaxID=1985254 RepID=UPI000528113C|nr:DUF418 domain-containing protein [Xanthomonas phaseoli]